MREISDDSAVHGAILADQVRGLDWKARQAKKKSKASNEIVEATLAVDGVPNPRHSGGASKVGIHYADADVSLFFLADAFLFYQHHSAQ